MAKKQKKAKAKPKKISRKKRKKREALLERLWQVARWHGRDDDDLRDDDGN